MTTITYTIPPVSVFGRDASEIEEGQIFIAHKVQISEGQKVILVPVIINDKDGAPSYEVRN